MVSKNIFKNFSKTIDIKIYFNYKEVDKMNKVKSCKFWIFLMVSIVILGAIAIMSFSYIKEKNHNYKGVFVSNGRLFENC